MGYLSTNAHGRVFNTCSQLCAPLCAGAAIAAGLMLSSFNVAAVKKESGAEGGREEQGLGDWGLGAVGVASCAAGIIFILTHKMPP